MSRRNSNASIPWSTQKAVAMKFWEYMKRERKRPKTRTEMRELFSLLFRPYLTDPVEKRVLLGQVLFNLKRFGLIEKQPPDDKETIVYRGIQSPENLLGAACCDSSQEPEPELRDDEVPALVAKLKKDLVSKRKILVKDKGGVSIHPAANSSDIIEMGKIDLTESKLLKLTVRNEKILNEVTMQCAVLGSARDFVFSDRLNMVENELKVKIKPLGHFAVEVKVQSPNPGVCRVPVGFEFKRQFCEPFHIVKFIKAETIDDVVKELQPISAYVKPKPLRNLNPDIEIVEGEPPELPDIVYTVPLDQYPVPELLRLVHQNHRFSLINLSSQSHHKKLTNLLHIEELQMKEDIQRFNMEKAKLERNGEFLTLNVPGLAENRPSLVPGDWLFVRMVGSSAKKEYKGFVHKVELNHVCLKFSRG